LFSSRTETLSHSNNENLLPWQYFLRKISFFGITVQASWRSLVHTWAWSGAHTSWSSDIPKVCGEDVVYGNRHTLLLVPDI
jgi:hypothetical protein